MTSIFEGQPPNNKAFSNQNKGHLASRYIYIYIYIQGSTYPTANISHLQGKPENHRLKSTGWDPDMLVSGSVHPGKLTWLAGKPNMKEDVSPI